MLLTLERDPTVEKLDLKKIAGPRQKAQEAPIDRQTSARNLLKLALAMHLYHEKHSCFPPATLADKDGKPLLSWRVALLPYLDEENLYNEFKLDEPWDSKHNKELLAKMPPVFGVDGKETFYQVFTGPDTVFDGPKGLQRSDITNRLDNTILVVECAKTVPWTKPEDFVYDAAKPVPKVGSLFPNGFHMAPANCESVQFIPASIGEKKLRAMISRKGEPSQEEKQTKQPPPKIDAGSGPTILLDEKPASEKREDKRLKVLFPPVQTEGLSIVFPPEVRGDPMRVVPPPVQPEPFKVILPAPVQCEQAVAVKTFRETLELLEKSAQKGQPLPVKIDGRFLLGDTASADPLSKQLKKIDAVESDKDTEPVRVLVCFAGSDEDRSSLRFMTAARKDLIRTDSAPGLKPRRHRDELPPAPGTRATISLTTGALPKEELQGRRRSNQIVTPEEGIPIIQNDIELDVKHLKKAKDDRSMRKAMEGLEKSVRMLKELLSLAMPAEKKP
jgi:hypothetical protein